MMGFSFTSTTALAMECEREHAGTASALSSAVGFGFGGLVSPLVGLDDTMVTTGIVFMACATCSLGCILWAIYIKSLGEKTIIGNLCYGGKYSETETLEEVRFIKNYFEKL